MHRAHVVGVTVMLAMAIVAGPPVSAAIDWRAEVPIARSDGGAFITDVSHRDKLSVIAWQVAGDETGALEVALSRDAGRGAFATRTVADGVDGAAVAACGTSAFVAYRERQADGGQRLRLARVPQDGGSIERVVIRRSVPARGSLDLACGTHRATVVWTERVDSTWHALVRHARLVDLGRTPVKDLGVAHRQRVAAAASGDRSYVAWSDATGLRFKRFVIGDGPAFAVAARSTQRLETDGRAPMVAADGTEVGVGYSSGAYAWIVSSHNGGRTFPDGTGYAVTPGDAALISMAIESRRGAATVELTYGDQAPLYHRLLRSNPEGSWNGRSAGQGVLEPLDGFLVTRAGTKLAETYVRADGDTEGWELLFRRER